MYKKVFKLLINRWGCFLLFFSLVDVVMVIFIDVIVVILCVVSEVFWESWGLIVIIFGDGIFFVFE